MEWLSDEIEEISGYPAGDFIDSAVRSFASVIPGARDRSSTRPWTPWRTPPVHARVSGSAGDGGGLGCSSA